MLMLCLSLLLPLGSSSSSSSPVCPLSAHPGLSHRHFRFFQEEFVGPVITPIPGGSSADSVRGALERLGCLKIFLSDAGDAPELMWTLASELRTKVTVYVFADLANRTDLEEGGVRFPTYELVLRHDDSGGSWIPHALHCPRGSFKEVPRISGKSLCKWSLHDGSLTVSAFGLAPFIRVGPDDGTLGGADLDVIGILSEQLGFSFRIRKEEFFGSWDENGGIKEGGSVGSVVYGHSDIGVGCLIINYNALKYMDFTYMNYGMNWRLCCRRPRAVPAYTNLLLPFSPEVWMAVLVVSAFGCLVSHFMFRSVQVWDKKGRATLKEEENREALYCFAIMFCQARPYYSSYYDFVVALRTLGAFWLSYAFFVQEMFSCNLRANLVSKGHEEMADTFDELFGQGRELFFLDTPLLWWKFRHLEEVSRRARPYPPSHVLPWEVQREVLENGACWTCNPYETSALTAIRMKKGLADSDGGGQSGQPPFLRGSQDLTSDYSGFVLPKGYPYKGDLDTVIGRLVQGGIFAHLLHRNEPGWHLQSTPGGASGSAREDLSPFGIRHLSGLWTAAAAGMTAALSVFVAEMRRRRKVVQARDVVELREMLG